jgi:uncharacterized protein (TIGR01777 family)
MPTVLITGGTGLIGKNLTSHLTAKGYHVIILSRKPLSSENSMVEYAAWDPNNQTIDEAATAKADHIICLAGAGVMDKRWSENYKKEIIHSRTRGNELIIKSLQAPNKVRTVISAAAIGWYGPDAKPLKKKFTENDPPSPDFLGQTCRQWEESIEPITSLHKRLVKLRTGIALSTDGGAYAEFIRPMKFGIAAVLGDGKQVISWIHMDDLCRMYLHAIENENISGTYNAVAPMPVENKELILKAAKKIRGTFFIPVHAPAFALKLVLGDRSTEILKSTTVSSDKISATGFTFLYPSIDAALEELTRKK